MYVDQLKIDFEESETQHRTIVSPNVDPELDELKRRYDGLESLLSEASKALENRITVLHASLNIIYFPQIGFLISIIADSDTGSDIHESEQLEGWEQMFITE